VVILGAGMSGLCLGIELKRAGIEDLVILEKQADLGGTWWDNRYPGAHVDVPAPLYSFSFEPNPRWHQRFAAAPEIQAYMAHCADKYGLRPHLRLGTAITAARFDEAQGLWTLDTQGPGSGPEEVQRIQARCFLCSTGPLSQVRWPDLPGLADFQGRKLHSARWDASYSAQGQRVAVIGTGSTASQLIPPLAQQAAQLHVFQRTANWVLPRIDRPYFAVDRLLARFPPYAWAVRAFWYHLLEWGRRGFDEGTMARRGMLKTAALHLRRQVPDAALREKLRPPYPLGCKRIIYPNDFYPALSQPQGWSSSPSPLSASPPRASSRRTGLSGASTPWSAPPASTPRGCCRRWTSTAWAGSACPRPGATKRRPGAEWPWRGFPTCS